MEPRVAVRDALARGQRAALVTVTALEGEPPSREGMALGVLENGNVFGTLGCDGFDRSGARDAARAIRERIRLERTYDWDESSRVRVEVRPFAPGEPVPGDVTQPELLVIGEGPVVRALLALAKVLGFRRRLVSRDPADLPMGAASNDAEDRIVVRGADEVGRLTLGPESYVVIAGHDVEFSQPSLRALLRSDAPYFGLMGSRRHTGHLLEELRADGYSETQLARVHTPVGLDLGAQTPEEIALAALAHIVAVRRGRAGSPLA